MKAITLVPLDDIIKEECKDKKFAALFQRELLINEISKIVVGLRKRSRMTQKELANKAGTTQPVIARLESGSDRRVPSLDLLTRLVIAGDATIKFAVSYNRNQLHKHC